MEIDLSLWYLQQYNKNIILFIMRRANPIKTGRAITETLYPGHLVKYLAQIRVLLIL
jgi:hypothetical protein